MIKLEQAARQALEALENHSGNYKLSKAECKHYDKVEADLREALEPEVAPDGRVAKTVFTLDDMTKAFEDGHKNGRLEALAEKADMNLSCKSVQARLATSWGYVKAEQAEQEPVGWTHAANLVDDGYGHIFSVHSSEPAYDDWIPLYATPVQQVDLTDDEIADIFTGIVAYKPTGYARDFARAVIAADREKNK